MFTTLIQQCLNNEHSRKNIEKLISNLHYLLLMQENKFLLSMYEISSYTDIKERKDNRHYVY